MSAAAVVVPFVGPVQHDTLRDFVPGAKIVAAGEKAWRDSEKWLLRRLAAMPDRWSAHLGAEHNRRGGLVSSAANIWLLARTEPGFVGRLPLSASDDDLQAAAKEAEQEARNVLRAAAGDGGFIHRRGVSVQRLEDVGTVGGEGFGRGAALALLERVCERWGIAPAEVATVADIEPAIKRMTCKRWWCRRLRKAHGRRVEGAAIAGGVVRRGMWPYSSQDGVERRKAQQRRNARALEKAVLCNEDTGENFGLAEIVEKSLANQEVKRSELMVRIRGADAYRAEQGWSCELWTITTPSRFHAQRVTGAVSDANPNYDGSTPKQAQGYISSVWSKARAAWARRGLIVSGLRTAEPHHDGCPHWHIVVYGPKRDLRFARRLLRVYALRDTPDEPGARKHRFDYKVAVGGQAGARYAAKYVAKNINGAGMDGERDGESGRKISASVERVSAWAANWGIRQFQFFGMPAVGVWRCLRRFRAPVAPVKADLEKARAAADRSDWCDFWRVMEKGNVELLKRDPCRLTAYGDAAAVVVAGVIEGARRAVLPVNNWAIHWAGKAKDSGRGALDKLARGFYFGVDLAFDLPWSGVNNCTGPESQPENLRALGLA